MNADQVLTAAFIAALVLVALSQLYMLLDGVRLDRLERERLHRQILVSLSAVETRQQYHLPVDGEDFIDRGFKAALKLRRLSQKERQRCTN